MGGGEITPCCLNPTAMKFVRVGTRMCMTCAEYEQVKLGRSHHIDSKIPKPEFSRIFQPIRTMACLFVAIFSPKLISVNTHENSGFVITMWWSAQASIEPIGVASKLILLNELLLYIYTLFVKINEWVSMCHKK